MIAVIAALGASLSWTTAALVAHGPARSLGAFDFTRTQLVSAAMILVVGAGATGAWTSVDWGFWPSYVTASLAGVVVGNLAMTACLRRGGPRRSQLLQATVGPLLGMFGLAHPRRTLHLEYAGRWSSRRGWHYHGYPIRQHEGSA